MNIHFNSVSAHALSFLGDRIAFSLTARQKIIMAIAVAAFACIAACYAVFRYAFPKRENTEIEEATSQSLAAGADPAIPPYSQKGQEALAFAREKLKEHSGIQPTRFEGGQEHQPVNPEISLLFTLYWDVYFGAFEKAVKKHRYDPWSQQEVIQAADDCMKISFALSCLALDDLPAFTQKLASQDESISFTEALTEKNFYESTTFYGCTDCYHQLRGGSVWKKNPWNNQEGLGYPDEALPAVFIQLFYDSQNQPIQHTWNALYNEYCDRVRKYVPEKNLQSPHFPKGERIVKWTQKDLDEKTFTNTPDLIRLT